MEIEQRLRELLEVEDPGQDFTDKVMARIAASPASSTAGVTRIDARRRKPGRRAIWGVATVLAAAASMLTLWLGSGEGTPAGSSTVDAAARVAALQSDAGASQVALDAGDAGTSSVHGSGTYTICVVLRDVPGQGAADIALASQLRDSVISELAQLPDFRVVEGIADCDVRIDFDGRASSGSRIVTVWAGAPPVLDLVQRLAAGNEAERNEYSKMQRRPKRFRPDGYSASTKTGFRTEALLDSPARSAKRLVRQLRAQILPFEDSFQRELVAQLHDEQLSTAQRADAFSDLVTIADRHESSVDAEVVIAAAELALAAPEANDRRRVWKDLLYTGNVELVPYLVRALQAERDSNLRRELIGELPSELAGDQRLRAVLDDVAHGSEPKNAVAEIKNRSLADTQRLDAVARLASPNPLAAANPVQLDDEAIRELGALLVRASRDPALRNSVSSATQALKAVDDSSARAVVLYILQQPDDLPPGESKASFYGLRSNMVMLCNQRFGADPEINSLIQSLAAGGDPAAKQVLLLKKLQSGASDPKLVLPR